jgi:hypothetical protein
MLAWIIIGTVLSLALVIVALCYCAGVAAQGDR